jgi:hypothetical protein
MVNCGMQITVNIPDELAVQAESRGLTVERFVEQVLQQQVPGEGPVNRPRSAEEVGRWLNSLARYSDRIPPLPEVISREWLYQDHD